MGGVAESGEPVLVTMGHMLGLHYDNNTGNNTGNNTLDVMCMGCFEHFDAIACIRNGIMSMMVLVTAILCVVKVVRLHVNKHPTIHQYIIFYSATIECIICAVHWLFAGYAQLDFVMQWLKLVQFLVVSHFYWTLATRAARKEMLTRRVLIPLAGVALLYFTVVIIFASIYVKPSRIECLQPWWVALSAAELALVQLFTIAGFYITKRLNEISTLDSIRRAQKRNLWSIIVAFELSALCSFGYDLTLMILGDEERGCSGIFLNKQEIYSPVFGVFMVVKFLLPIWAMLLVFQPMQSHQSSQDLLPAVNRDGTYSSVFSPSHDVHHRYQPLNYPGVSPVASSPDLSPGMQANGSSTSIYEPIRRTSSNLNPIQEGEEVEGGPGDTSERRPMLR